MSDGAARPAPLVGVVMGSKSDLSVMQAAADALAEFQVPFEVNHATMRALALNAGLPTHTLAANLRRAFSGIVTGNVKEYGVRLIEQAGPFELKADDAIVRQLDGLLSAFVQQKRMKIASGHYTPCYRLVT